MLSRGVIGCRREQDNLLTRSEPRLESTQRVKCGTGGKHRRPIRMLDTVRAGPACLFAARSVLQPTPHCCPQCGQKPATEWLIRRNFQAREAGPFDSLRKGLL